jgi:hypothetical protein
MPRIRLLLLTNLISSAIYPQNKKQKIKTKENKKKRTKILKNTKKIYSDNALLSTTQGYGLPSTTRF